MLYVIQVKADNEWWDAPESDGTLHLYDNWVDGVKALRENYSGAILMGTARLVPCDCELALIEGE